MPTRSSDRSCSSSLSGVNPQNTRWSEACCVSPRREIAMKVQTLAGIVSVGALLFGFGEVAMSQTSQPGNVRNVVLVHGGWVDGSGWEGVYKALQKSGYAVTIVQEATTSLADDVATTKRAIALQNGPVILVGHSYGGGGSDGAGHAPMVRGRVYIWPL